MLESDLDLLMRMTIKSSMTYLTTSAYISNVFPGLIASCIMHFVYLCTTVYLVYPFNEDIVIDKTDFRTKQGVSIHR